MSAFVGSFRMVFLSLGVAGGDADWWATRPEPEVRQLGRIERLNTASRTASYLPAMAAPRGMPQHTCQIGPIRHFRLNLPEDRDLALEPGIRARRVVHTRLSLHRTYCGEIPDLSQFTQRSIDICAASNTASNLKVFGSAVDVGV